MAYYTALQTIWATLPSTDTTAQKLAAVNAMTVDGPNQDVPVANVEGYLSIGGILTNMEDWLAANTTPSAARTSAKELLRTIASPHVMAFNTSAPETYAALQGMLNALAASPPALLTAANVSALLAMAATTLPWWQANGYSSPISSADMIAAGGLS